MSDAQISQPGSPQPQSISTRPTGLTLVLPPLKGGKPLKGNKKSKQRIGSQTLPGAHDGPDSAQDRKVHRPVKLKPLKEVLMKLITQIKKKDDYAFFLHPVDPVQVPGYSDVVKRPMDFGTMTTKVTRGRYRSLEDFAADFRLVIANAKSFNPPGTIYYTEADRIEAWGLEHITKSASTVIQYETDWNIEIEKDDDGSNVNVDDDEELATGTPMDVDEPGPGARSPSVTSQTQPGATGPRRGPRGPYKKTALPNHTTETIGADGRLPGSSEGLGAFPPGSEWANMMLALKLKGKRYRTKKERLRIEKEGPPCLSDGSLDYTELEDPFSIISALVPTPPTRPYVTPLHPLPQLPSSSNYNQDQSDVVDPVPLASTSSLASINVPLDRRSYIPSISANNTPTRRHWTINRNLVTRGKGKDKEEEPEMVDPAWHVPREAHATDFGSLAWLAGSLEEERRRRAVSGSHMEENQMVNEIIRGTLDCEPAAKQRDDPPGNHNLQTASTYWTNQQACDAEGYVRDLVYGGVDGFAYVRSLAEFTNIDEPEFSNPEINPHLGLGMPVNQWVLRNIVDPLTDSRHRLLRQTANILAAKSHLPAATRSQNNGEHESHLADQVSKSLEVYPSVSTALTMLLRIYTHKIDMGALIKLPEELFLSEEEWAGKDLKAKRIARLEAQLGYGTSDPHSVLANTPKNPDGGTQIGENQDLEGPEELKDVLDYVAGVIIELNREIQTGSMNVHASIGSQPEIGSPALTDSGKQEQNNENSLLRNLRLNLLALAKRAPLDTIAKLPKDLVPEHIRHFVPTLSTSS
ncbi:hypothetical protein BD779DRAFT_769027 [Infundibulicybe gibba]|nr:hypothetical protein BD779DRAFT_769027 [Infundibulicybe gibba]